MRKLKKSLLVLGLAASASPASASEWTGAYIGIGGGMGAAVHDLSV